MLILGNRHVERLADSEPAGRSEAFPFVAGRSATASSARVYLGAHNRARTVLIALYSNESGHPHLLLTDGSLAHPRSGSWNTLPLHSLRLTASAVYWLAILGKGGSAGYRDRGGGRCISQTSALTHLVSFPRTWRRGAIYRSCAISAYVIGALRRSAPRSHKHGAAPVASYSSVPCTSTLGSASEIEAALQRAPGGTGICLNTGSYTSTETDLADINPASTVTLEPAPGATVNLGWLYIRGNVHNLTVQDLNLTGGVAATGNVTNVVFQHNTISGRDGARSGFYFYGNGGQQRNIRVLYNDMHDLAPKDLTSTGAGQCVTVVGTAAQEHQFNVSHNVCGPNIAGHYTQFGGIDGLTEDYNTFLGPPSPEVFADNVHNNVLQIFGNSTNIDFSHNVMQRTDARGQEILVEEGKFADVTMNNNLFIGDPQCLTNWNCYSYAVGLCAAQGLQFNYNTVVGYHWGVQITNSLKGGTGCWPQGSRYVITHNIVVGTNDNVDITYAECGSKCRVRLQRHPGCERETGGSASLYDRTAARVEEECIVFPSRAAVRSRIRCERVICDRLRSGATRSSRT